MIRNDNRGKEAIPQQTYRATAHATNDLTELPAGSPHEPADSASDSPSN